MAQEDPYPTLSIVIPVYNEPDWIQRSVPRVAEALKASRWRDPEIVVIDDGSTEETARILDALRVEVPLRVVHQANLGRLEARRAGLREAKGQYTFFLDARVLLTGGLDGLVDRVSEGKTVWNAHCEVSYTNVLGAFWDAVPRIFWHEYLSNPRTVSYGIAEFQRYPKGTTGFVAPTAVLRDAYGAFRSSYADNRHANDDTTLIEWIARRHTIWLSPEFSIAYEPRHSMRRFIPHAFHRGVVFVDGFLHPGNPYAPAIVGFYGGSVATLFLARRHRSVIPGAYALAVALAVGAGMYRRLNPRHLRALAAVTPVFVTAYGAGIWAGLLMKLRDSFKPPHQAAHSPVQLLASANAPEASPVQQLEPEW
ncbi:MAG TPA: glycosyltransferase family 2 protein [Chloroflexota bacterium]|jgi:glycosyltransferase involved in cell wall biosynthesis|nr:glycosyltransferase family 2 protein [Chloroflexota bacterium]